MSVSQAIMAARAGAKYVSLFWGRIRSGGEEEKFATERKDYLERRVIDEKEFDPSFVMRSFREMLDKDGLDTEIIAGSIRGIVDIRDAALSGAHIVTVPPQFFKDMMTHFKTDEVVSQFMTDFKSWLA